ncbi:uncharacterized protein F54H12.2-like [Xenopus tropicalis]|uniref:Uncharacterized protein F54H12.2-like n=1 Tax=Xenopus tropicalis TaxID=8364 RepID=A0A8J1IVU2_XENTR|nr:uncharacterized protein F54H12.2-like [Xenopus tropicalis]
MAFIHTSSVECAKSELDLFEIPPTQTSVEKSFYVEVQPLSAITDTSPLEFYIAGSGEHYLDLNNTLLYITCRILKNDNTIPADGARVSLINYPIATLFNQLDVTLGDRLISQSNNLYAYRAYIETILNYSTDALSTQFTAGLFYKDTPGQHHTRVLDGDNEGFTKRARLMERGKTIELLGILHGDIFQQDKLLLSGLDLKIKLTRNKDLFCLMSSEVDPFKVQILNASLFVKRVQVSPAVRIGHAQGLLTSNAKYIIDRVSMKVFSIPAGSRVCNQENLFLGQLPKLVILGFVDNESFSGAYNRNPLCFYHNYVCFAALYVDGIQIPSKPYLAEFENGNAIREYMSLVQIAGKKSVDSGFLIDRESFLGGYTLFGFDLTPDQESSSHFSLIRNGNLRAEIRFSRALDRTVNMIVYGVFDNIIEVNQRREVLYDFL